MQLEGTQVVGADLIGGTAGVTHQTQDAGEVGFDGAWGVIAPGEFSEETLPQRSHDTILRKTLGRTRAGECHQRGHCARAIVTKVVDLLSPAERVSSTPFWRSKYAKATTEYRLGVKAKEWFIYHIDDLGGQHIARVAKLTPEFREAMDSGCHSFDLVASKVLARYTPDQNERI